MLGTCARLEVIRIRKVEFFIPADLNQSSSRYVEIRQNQGTKLTPGLYHTGELEKTILDRFCMGQSLRAKMSKLCLPAYMHAIADKFQQRFGIHSQGTLASDIKALTSPLDPGYDDEKLVTLPGELIDPLTIWVTNSQRIPRGSLTPRTGVIHKEVDHLGVSFKPTSRSSRDSNIVFRCPHRPTLVAARIHYIFSIRVYQNEGHDWYTLCAVRRFSELSAADAAKDVYRRFGVFSGWVCSAKEGHLDVIQLRDIQCHVALTPDVLPLIESSHFHILPLDRVSGKFCIIRQPNKIHSQN